MNQFLKNLNSIKERVRKPIMKTTEIPINKKFKIIKALRVKTKFGEKVMIELDESVLFLPESYNALEDSTIEALNSHTFYIECIKRGEKFTSPLFEFHTE